MRLLKGQSFITSGRRFKITGVWQSCGVWIGYDTIQVMADPVAQDEKYVTAKKLTELKNKGLIKWV